MDHDPGEYCKYKCVCQAIAKAYPWNKQTTLNSIKHYYCWNSFIEIAKKLGKLVKCFKVLFGFYLAQLCFLSLWRRLLYNYDLVFALHWHTSIMHHCTPMGPVCLSIYYSVLCCELMRYAFTKTYHMNAWWEHSSLALHGKHTLVPHSHMGISAASYTWYVVCIIVT